MEHARVPGAKKKTPGTFRLVQDLRPQNEATIKDGHPLPRIGEMVQRQGKNKIWSTMDLVDGFHQMPMKPEHRHITCMSTPRGQKQWTCQVMGLKNAGAQFQRMMEWVLRDAPEADAYIDDVIIGSQGTNEDAAIWANFHHIKKVLTTMQAENLVASLKKVNFSSERWFSADTSCAMGDAARPPANYSPYRIGSCRKPSRNCVVFWGNPTIFRSTFITMRSTRLP